MKKYKFVTALLTLYDFLSTMVSLSRAFQMQDLDYSLVKPLVSGTLAALRNLTGQYFQSLDSFFEDREDHICNISIPVLGHEPVGLVGTILGE